MRFEKLGIAASTIPTTVASMPFTEPFTVCNTSVISLPSSLNITVREPSSVAECDAALMIMRSSALLRPAIPATAITRDSGTVE